MSLKPKKRKELQQAVHSEVPTTSKPSLDLATTMSIFFILLYAFGVVTNLQAGNRIMALVWTVLIGVNLFFIFRNRRLKK